MRSWQPTLPILTVSLCFFASASRRLLDRATSIHFAPDVAPVLADLLQGSPNAVRTTQSEVGELVGCVAERQTEAGEVKPVQVDVTRDQVRLQAVRAQLEDRSSTPLESLASCSTCRSFCRYKDYMPRWCATDSSVA
jgi:hypothetical protein